MLGVALEFKSQGEEGAFPVTPTVMNQMQKLLIDLVYPIGSYFETSDVKFDPNKAWGGTWNQDDDGTVLVSNSTKIGSKFNQNVGTVLGEEEHTLIIEEIAKHNHEVEGNVTAYVDSGNKDSAETTGSRDYVYVRNHLKISNAGGDKAHNNIQPSKIVNRWHRIA